MALAIQAPVEQFSATALPYQLSSWALDDPANVGLWEDGQGQLIAFALLQIPFNALNYVIHPTADVTQLKATILAWSVARASEWAKQQATPFTFSYLVAENDLAMADLVQAYGFVRQEPARVLLSRTRQQPIPPVALPDGFRLRHLAGPEEVAAATALLAAAFRINTVTELWRRRILQQAAYRAELDVVVEAPNGDLASF